MAVMISFRTLSVAEVLQQFRLKILEREGPDCLAQLICRGPDFVTLSEYQLSGFLVKEKWRRLGQVAVGGAGLLIVEG